MQCVILDSRLLDEKLFFLFSVLGIEPRALYIFSKCCTTELHPHPLVF
jgi:hypothetical protein